MCRQGKAVWHQETACLAFALAVSKGVMLISQYVQFRWGACLLRHVVLSHSHLSKGVMLIPQYI